MAVEYNKVKDHMLADIAQLRRKLSEFEGIEKELSATRQEVTTLQERLKDQAREFAREKSARNKSERELRLSQLIVDRSPVVLFRRFAGDTPTLEYISDNIRQFGYSPEEFLSGERLFKDVVHPDDMEQLRSEINSFADADVEEYSQHYRIFTKSGETRWVEDQTSVVRDQKGSKTHNQGILIDITERKLAEDAVYKSEEKFRRIVETTAEGFLLMDEDQVIKEVNDSFCRLVGYKKEELIGRMPHELSSESFRKYMQPNAEALLAQEYREFEAEIVAKDGTHIPILVHGNILTDDQGNVIGNMAFITDMTEQKKALALAGEVQKSLLPQEKPKVAGLDVAGRNISCDEIGGDYFDFLYRAGSGKGAFSVVVGDISGHGVDSALLMTTARAFLRMRASQPGSLSEIISAMNRHLAQDVLKTGRFMTLFYLSIDPEKKQIEWVRAGHDPAFIYDPGRDSFEELKGAGIALGITDEFNYEENQREGLTDGQIIVVGTDGVWEAINMEGEMFGKERVQELIRIKAKSGANAEEILDSVYTELDSFTVGCKREDDITLVITKVGTA